MRHITLRNEVRIPKKKDDGDDALWSAASKGYLCMWYVRENLRGMKEEFYASNDDIRMITDIKNNNNKMFSILIYMILFFV